MRGILASIFLIAGIVASSAQEPKIQAMGACKYEILKLGRDAFSGLQLALACMESKGYVYDNALPECSGDIRTAAFDANCFTTLAQWEQVLKGIHDCQAAARQGPDQKALRADVYGAAVDACLASKGYVATGFGQRPIGYGKND